MLRRINGRDAAMMALVDRPFGVMMPSRSCSGVRPDAEVYCGKFWEMFLTTPFS